MAIYRQIQIEFWQDAFVLDLTPEEKYFYLYLLTNTKTRQCGIYELPTKIIETETGYSRETVEKLINRFEEYKKITYDFETKEIYLKNWIKYNKISNIKIQKCVEKEIKNVKSEKLLKLFFKDCKEQGYTFSESINHLVGIKPAEKHNENHKENSEANKENKEKGNENYLEKKENLRENLNEEDNTRNTNNNRDIKYYSENQNLKEFAKLYEENLGLINGSSSQWLIEISQKLDINLFKKSIEIAKKRGQCNKGYVNGIITNWQNNKITTLEELDIYEKKLNYRGEHNHGANKNHQQSKYAAELQNEDESIYQKPTREQIEYTRKLLNGL
ncbi:DnaD domain protein [Romboutsia sp.]|uniref:DnaD domain protein n=1 Tax=Romboutsia sp. TaxID=1965302 RepID=UPI003F2D6D38